MEKHRRQGVKVEKGGEQCAGMNHAHRSRGEEGSNTGRTQDEKHKRTSHGTEHPSATTQEGISHMTALRHKPPESQKKKSRSGIVQKRASPPSPDISVRVKASLIGYAGKCPRADLPSKSGSRGRHFRCLLPFVDSPPSARSSFVVSCYRHRFPRTNAAQVLHLLTISRFFTST